VVASQSDLNRKMHQLHLNDQQDFDDFPDDDHENQHHHPTFEVYDDDDLFLDSEDDDGFLSSEEEDEFLDTDEEEGRMDGVDVLGYPWPEQMGGGVDDCLDEPDHQRSGGHHEVLDFDNEFDNLHDHEPEHPIDPSFDNSHLKDYDEFLDSDVEDQPPNHLLVTPPLSLHHHHPSGNDLLGHDHHSDHDDDFLEDDDELNDDFLDEVDDLENHASTFHQSSPTDIASIPLLPYQPPIPQYILPRTPQFSLGQAATIVSHQTPDQKQGHEDDFLDSDNEGSEMGVYTADQYLPNPHPEPESEMGVYTADEEFLESDPELESVFGDYTADHQSNLHQGPLGPQAEAESEMGVYTADQFFESHQTSSFLTSPQSMDGQEGFWNDDEEVVYRIPSLPPVDMRHYHYQYHQEDIDDDLPMSDGDAMSIHSDLAITPHNHPAHGQAIQLDNRIVDGDSDRMNLDRPSGYNTLDAGGHFSDVLLFNNQETLDEAMPA
jgi:hypothetical protein